MKEIASTKRTLFLKDKTIAILILSNITALLTAIHWDWSILDLIFLFWFETAIIGLLTIIKIIHTAKIGALFLAPFFCVHFGMFMFVHLVFIFSLFGDGMYASTFSSESLTLFVLMITTVFYPALALFASHLFSFFKNYLGQKEYEKRSFIYFFSYPYPRVVVMHLTLLISAFLVQSLSVTYGLIILVTLKTLTDVLAHKKMHADKHRSDPLKELSQIPDLIQKIRKLQQQKLNK